MFDRLMCKAPTHIPLGILQMTADYANIDGMRQQVFAVDCVGNPDWQQIGHQLAMDACLENETWLGCWWKGEFEVKAQLELSLTSDHQIRNVKIKDA